MNLYNLECQHCKRHNSHGGNCEGKYSVIPCLAFDRDPRGEQVYKNVSIPVPFWASIPKLNEDCSMYTIGGVDKTFQITRIYSLEWDKDKTGLRGLLIDAQIKYWSDENGVIVDKPKLTLVKGGAE